MSPVVEVESIVPVTIIIASKSASEDAKPSVTPVFTKLSTEKVTTSFKSTSSTLNVPEAVRVLSASVNVAVDESPVSTVITGKSFTGVILTSIF